MTAAIPEVLHNPEFRFLKVESRGKRPIEKDWQNTRNYRYDDPELLAWLQQGGNYGVICGPGGLRVVDLDDVSRARYFSVTARLPKTFRVSSRENREHLYFLCPELDKKLIFHDPEQVDSKTGKLRHLGEVQGPGTFVVGPGSVHPDSRVPYVIMDKRQIAPINKADLMASLGELSFEGRPGHGLEQNIEKLEGMVREARQKRIITDDQKGRRYAEAALAREVEKVRNAGEGERNNQLFKSAAALGELVAAGVLRESEVIFALEGAAEDGEPEKIGPTIRSGLDAGARHPREIPESRPMTASVPCDQAGETEGLAWEDVMVNWAKNADGSPDDEEPDWHFSPTLASKTIHKALRLAMCEESEDIYRYNGQVWKPDGTRKIDMALCDAAMDNATSRALSETLRRIENNLLDNPIQFEPDHYLLPVKNGVANLLTREVREYRPEDFLLDQLDVTYDPDARCPTFLKFLVSSAPNISDRITLIDWFVATAIKEPLPYALFLLGLGRNGKGIYERLIKRFFGAHNFRDMDLEEVVKNNFAQSTFFRIRGWIASETGKKKKPVIGTNFVKMTSGNGVIDADRKNKDRIRFEPYFQTIVDTNLMPKIEDSSIGWIERFIKVDLPYVFVANPSPSNPLEKERDPALFEKLTTPGELSGILNLLLFRSKAIGRSRTIHKRPGAEMFAEYAEQSSSVATFAELFLEYDAGLQGVRIPTREIYDFYKEWCGYKVGEVVEASYFGRYLRKLCGGRDPARPKIDGKDATVYPGLLFHKDRFLTAIQELKRSRGIAVSEAFVSSSEANSKQIKNKESQEISFSEASEAKLWNEIIQLFGEPGRQPGEPHREDTPNLLPMPPMLTKTATAELTRDRPASELPANMPPKKASVDAIEANAGLPTKEETTGIKADLQRAKEFRAEKEVHEKTPGTHACDPGAMRAEVRPQCPACGAPAGPGYGHHAIDGLELCHACGYHASMVWASARVHNGDSFTIGQISEDLSSRTNRPPDKAMIAGLLRVKGYTETDGRWRSKA